MAAKKKPLVPCSFCGKTAEEATAIVQARRAAICERCALHVLVMLADKRKAGEL